MKIHPRRAAALLLAVPLAVLAHGAAHQHGAGTLDIAVDARQIIVQFDSPLDNLVGFERAPRTDSEHRRVDEAGARLRAGDTLFKFDAAAGCKLARTNLDSPVLGLGSNGATATQGHADLHASWEFDCADAGKATQVEVGLFAFRQIKRLQVQLALPKAQLKRELKRPNGRLVLGP